MLFFLFLSLVSSESTACENDCCFAINAFNKAFDTTLPTDADCCVLDGIECSDGRVKEIHWNSSQATGEIPEELGNLEKLKILDLANNSFIGEIPASYYSFPELEILRLKNNSLSGNIGSFSNAKELTAIDLSDNQFQGQIATDAFESLQKLKFINVGGNQGLTGTFPNPGPQVRLINTVGTNITLCGAAAKVAVPAYFDMGRMCPNGSKK